ncbi:hypothetical protein JCM10207_003583 [Rhodosporidiobolus poonsookiae]
MRTRSPSLRSNAYPEAETCPCLELVLLRPFVLIHIQQTPP